MAKCLAMCAAIAAVVIGANTVGCKAEDQDKVVAQGRDAIGGAKAALASAYESVSKEAQKLGINSSGEALSRARDQASAVAKSLSEMKAPSELDALHLEVAKQQLQRLQAAIDVQALKREWEAALQKANEGKNLSETGIENARKALADKDAQFQKLDANLNAAQRTYKNACNRLAELLNQQDNQAPSK